MKNNRWVRFIVAMLLCLGMVVQCVPAVAFAAATEQQGVVTESTEANASGQTDEKETTTTESETGSPTGSESSVAEEGKQETSSTVAESEQSEGSDAENAAKRQNMPAAPSVETNQNEETNQTAITVTGRESQTHSFTVLYGTLNLDAVSGEFPKDGDNSVLTYKLSTETDAKKFSDMPDDLKEKLGLTNAKVSLTKETEEATIGKTRFTYTLANAPTRYTYTDASGVEQTAAITWNYDIPRSKDYARVVNNNQTFEIVRADVKYTIRLNAGGSVFDTKTLRNLLNAHFDIVTNQAAASEDDEPGDLVKSDDISSYLTIAEGEDPGSADRDHFYLTYDADKKEITLHGNPPRYTTGNQRVSFTLKEKTDTQDNAKPEKLTYALSGIGDLPEGIDQANDVLMPGSYVLNETRMPLSVREGKNTFLTLSGTASISIDTYYEDGLSNDDDKNAQRSQYQYSLWRAPADSETLYANGTQVRYPVRRDENGTLDSKSGQVILVDGVKTEDHQTITFPPDGYKIPKYDTLGNKYIYYIKESVKSSGSRAYSTSYGTKTTDNEFKEETEEQKKEREESSGSVLTEGMAVSHRFSDTTPVKVSLSFKMRSFLREIPHMKVLLKLQSRVKGSNGTWEDGSVQYVASSFDVDNTKVVSVVNPPKYNADGDEIEYRLRACGVTYKPEGGDEQKQEFDPNKRDPDNKSVPEFYINFGTLEVPFEVTRTNTGSDEPNQDEDKTPSYEIRVMNVGSMQVTKKWVKYDENGNEVEMTADDPEIRDKEVKLAVFRHVDGEMIDFETASPYLTFTLTANAVKDKQTDPNHEDAREVDFTTVKPFSLILDNLKRFDAAGEAYVYNVFEVTKGADGKDKYVTNNVQSEIENVQVGDKENEKVKRKHATVTNPVGPSPFRITIAKNWDDASDLLARGDTEFEIYYRTNTTDTNYTLYKTVIMKSASSFWIAGVDIEDLLEQLVTDRDALNNLKNNQNELENFIEQHIRVREKSVSIGSDKCYVQYNRDNSDNGNLGTSDSGTLVTSKSRYAVSTSFKYVENLAAKVFVVNNVREKVVNFDLTNTWVVGNGNELNQLRTAIENYNNNHKEDGKKIGPALVLKATREDVTGGITLSADHKSLIIDGDTEHPYPIMTKPDENGKTESSAGIIPLTLLDNRQDASDPDETLSMYGLPLYDLDQRIITYSVVEQFVNLSTGEEVDFSKLPDDDNTKIIKEIWAKISRSVSSAKDDQPASTLHTLNFINRLSQMKTVTWDKHWYDYASYVMGTRPDLYIDIYGYSNGKLNLVRPNYQWVVPKENMSSNAGNVNSTINWWQMTMSMPAYDDNGYPITYYATEHLGDSATQIYYRWTTYGNGTGEATLESGLTKSGTATDQSNNSGNGGTSASVNSETVQGSASDAAQTDDTLTDVKTNETPATETLTDVKMNDKGEYLLKEGNTFINRYSDTVELKLTKEWKNLPDSTGEDGLPETVFTIKRYMTEGEGTGTDDPTYFDKDHQQTVGTFTVSKWQNGTKTEAADSSGKKTVEYKYDFILDHTSSTEFGGANEVCEKGSKDDNMSFEKKLQKFSPQGYEYTYVIEEKDLVKDNSDDSVDPDTVFEVDYNSPKEKGKKQTITNTYNPTSKVKLQIHKEMVTRSAGKPTMAVQFQLLTRSYAAADAKGTRQTIKDTADRFYKFTGEKWNEKNNEANTWTADTEEIELPKYSPRGLPYVYYVVEPTTGGTVTFGNNETLKIGKNYIGNSKTTVAKADFDSSRMISTGDTQNAVVGGIQFKENEAKAVVTFQNELQDPQVKLKLSKIWKDNSNQFGMRPDSLKVKLHRYYDAQPDLSDAGKTVSAGKGNASTPADDWKPEVTMEKSDQTAETADTWESVVTVKLNETETETTFPAIAPNGMPYHYVAEEVTPDRYTTTNAKKEFGVVTTAQDNKTQVIKASSSAAYLAGLNLESTPAATLVLEGDEGARGFVNTVYGPFKWSKKLVGADGYPGYTFTMDLGVLLQYREITTDADGKVTKGDWKYTALSNAAKDLNNDDLAGSTEEGILNNALEIQPRKPGETVKRKTLSNIILSNKDTEQSYSLPKRIGSYEVNWIFYEKAFKMYEGTDVFNSEPKHTVTLTPEIPTVADGKVTYPSPNNDELLSKTDVGVKEGKSPIAATTITNTLKVFKLKLIKEWDDAGFEAYRPAGENWKISFQIQRKQKIGNGEWGAYEKFGTDPVTLTGAKTDKSKSVTLRYPAVEFNDEGTMIENMYRAVELVPEINSGTDSLTDETATATTVVSGRLTGTPYEVMTKTEGSQATENSFDLVDNDKDGVYTETVTNKLPTKKLTIRKNILTGSETTPAFQFKLYKKTGENGARDELGTITLDGAAMEKPETVTTTDNAKLPLYTWQEKAKTTETGKTTYTAEVTGLPKFRSDEEYFYEVEEVTDDNEYAVIPANTSETDKEQAEAESTERYKLTGSAVNPKENKSDEAEWIFTNQEAAQLTISKEWLVKSDAVKKPVVVEIYHDAGCTKQDQLTASVVLNKDNQYKATVDVEAADAKTGEKNTFYVKEVYVGDDTTGKSNDAKENFELLGSVEEGSYTVQAVNSAETTEETENAASTVPQYTAVIKNRELLTISVKKTWVDQEGALRPENLSFHLNRTTEGSEQEPQLLVTKTVDAAAKDASEQTVTFTKLPATDENGNAYIYTVDEDPITGYDPVYGEKGSSYQDKEGAYTANDHTVLFYVTNIGREQLTVAKKVTGGMGSATKEFRFRVTLTGENATTGMTAESFADSFKGSEDEQTIAFAPKKSDDGTRTSVAEFKLKHDQEVTFLIPAGFSYEVEELDANTDHYRTSVINTLDAQSKRACKSAFDGTAESTKSSRVEFTNDKPDVEIYGFKTWLDRQTQETRPELVLHLERTVGGSSAWETVEAEPKWEKDDTYSGTIGERFRYSLGYFPAYSENGSDYTYRVTEEVPEGYSGRAIKTKQDNRFDFVNVKDGAIHVSNEIRGNAADKTRSFHYQLQLLGVDPITGEDELLNDTFAVKGAMPGEALEESETVEDLKNFLAVDDLSGIGSEVETSLGQKVSLTSAGAEFTLTDQEEITFELPAGVRYRLTQTDANADGYKTTVNGEAKWEFTDVVPVDAERDYPYLNEKTKNPETDSSRPNLPNGSGDDPNGPNQNNGSNNGSNNGGSNNGSSRNGRNGRLTPISTGDTSAIVPMLLLLAGALAAAALIWRRKRGRG